MRATIENQAKICGPDACSTFVRDAGDKPSPLIKSLSFSRLLRRFLPEDSCPAAGTDCRRKSGGDILQSLSVGEL